MFNFISAALSSAHAFSIIFHKGGRPIKKRECGNGAWNTCPVWQILRASDRRCEPDREVEAIILAHIQQGLSIDG